jgi:hypothetical protein
MQKRRMGEVICENSACNKQFSKPTSELERNRRIGRKNFCSRSCVGKSDVHGFSKNRKSDPKYLQSGNRADEFTGFRELLKRIKRRDENTDVTLEFLKELFERQGGKCIYSKVSLKMPNHRGKNNPVITASIDRIDSSIRYLKSNIQFVSVAINLMKGQMTHKETVEFIDLLRL